MPQESPSDGRLGLDERGDKNSPACAATMHEGSWIPSRVGGSLKEDKHGGG